MPLQRIDNELVWRQRSPVQQRLIWLGWFLGVCLFLFCAKVVSDNTIWEFRRRA